MAALTTAFVGLMPCVCAQTSWRPWEGNMNFGPCPGISFTQTWRLTLREVMWFGKMMPSTEWEVGSQRNVPNNLSGSLSPIRINSISDKGTRRTQIGIDAR